MKSAYSDIGFVVRSADYGEADKLITILSENHGLVFLMAKGARRPTSKKSSHLDLLNLLRFSVGRGEATRFLHQAETVSFFPGIKSDYAKVGASLTVAEILTGTLPAEVEDREIFLSLKVYLDHLEKAATKKDINRLTRQFALYLLRHLGFPPPKNPQTDNLAVYFESIMNRKIISKDIK